MARSIDNGAGDSIDYGSDASIDDFILKSFCMWQQIDLVVNTENSSGKFSGANDWSVDSARALAAEANAHLRFRQDFTTVDGDWAQANNSLTLGVDQAVALTYDRGATANNPSSWVNGTSVAMASVVVPVGASNGDAANSLSMGPDGGVQVRTVGWFVYNNTTLTAADANRHRWHGMAPGGPSTMDVWHPFVTDSTVNKGTATADAALTGTTMVSIPKVSRPGCGTF
jgi:hypothetical protein